MHIKTAVFAMLFVGVGCSQAQKDLHNQLWQRTPQSPGPQRIGLVPEPSRRFQDLDSSIGTVPTTPRAGRARGGSGP